MKFTLRPYQQEAVNAAIEHIKKSVMPGLLELATGSGKSLIVASIAKWIHEKSGKKVLCIQPTKELTLQNFEKFIATGSQASIYSASAGSKCMRHPVVYGTPGTLKNALSRLGDAFGAVILDEAHGNTPTIRLIIDSMREKNPNLRVIGMTATPYVMGSGYIYQYDVDGSFVPEDEAIEPYFNNLLYKMQTRELIDMGFLTSAHADPEISVSYDASSLEVSSLGKFDQHQVEKVFEGQGRLTSQIVADIVGHSAGRKGVMIFAATVAHAVEVMQSLPPDNSMMLGGEINMKKSEREKLISNFKAQRFKYLVSVGTLTTGFDAPHVDVVAVMRATESAGLLQQIIGRGLRLYEGKEDCLVLDYADNVDRHELYNDLFTPRIKAKKASSGTEVVNCSCPWCNFGNEFTARPNLDGFSISEDGYFLDLDNNKISTEYGDMPAHLGRRCQGQVKSPLQAGVYERCNYLWTFKECPECQEPNDITARFCSDCRAELVDPNERLRIDFHRVKKDPYSVSTDKILAWEAAKSVSAAGNDVIRCEYRTEYRTFTVWYAPESRAKQAVAAWESLNNAVFSGHVAPDADTFMQYLHKGKAPETITCHRVKGSNFYTVIAHNRPKDKIPE